jgi:hypothetical protein
VKDSASKPCLPLVLESIDTCEIITGMSAGHAGKLQGNGIVSHAPPWIVCCCNVVSLRHNMLVEKDSCAMRLEMPTEALCDHAGGCTGRDEPRMNADCDCRAGPTGGEVVKQVDEMSCMTAGRR